MKEGKIKGMVELVMDKENAFKRCDELTSQVDLDNSRGNPNGMSFSKPVNKLNEGKYSKNLKLHFSTCDRLALLSQESGFTQSMIVEYLIDDFSINRYKQDDFVFNIFNV